MENAGTKHRQSLFFAILVSAALAGIGIATRILLADFPNFNMTLAIAIFIGYAIADRRIAIASIILMMGISDAMIGFYDWPIMLSVYLGLMVAWASGWGCRAWIDSAHVGWKLAGIVTAAVGSAVVFFLITNAACCLIGWYPMSWSGLLTSLSAGVPFFRSTLTSTVCFSLFIFAGYFAAQSAIGWSLHSAANR